MSDNLPKDQQQLAQQRQLLGQLQELVSESRNSATMEIDTLSTEAILQLINQQDQLVASAVQLAIPEIGQAVDQIVNSFQSGGRLIYIGAGTSGRLGILDAVECPPTFSVSPDQVVGLIAGGQSAIYQAVEGAEDDPQLAVSDLKKLNLTQADFVVGIAASGRTPYVIGGLTYASQIGAGTAAISCNPGSPILALANVGICAIVGAEVLTGSTRMKSGTAQKLILNMLTTASMIRCGKTYQNLMVDVKASNEKLFARASHIVMQATGCDHVTARETLELAEYSAKHAILMVLTGVSYNRAKSLIEQHSGFLGEAVASQRSTSE